jgi:hypothetical protein
LISVPGCGPRYTYPAGTVVDAIQEICLKEYNLKARARVVGKTVGAVFYMPSILDESGQISRNVHENLGKVMQAVTRVALSTDLPLDFCTAILREKKHGEALIITRSVDDTKRANADMIGIEESQNRTLLVQEKFQTNPVGEDVFVLEEIKLENFLAAQIVQRIRFYFSKENRTLESGSRPLILADGLYDTADGKRIFRFAIMVLKSDDPRELMRQIFRIVNAVIEGYRFNAFDEVQVEDFLNRQKLVLQKQIFLDFQKKKVTEDEVLIRNLSELGSAAEAFKLFGFKLSKTAADNDSALGVTATV